VSLRSPTAQKRRRTRMTPSAGTEEEDVEQWERRRVEIYWDGNKKWYMVSVHKCNEVTRKIRIRYDDVDEESYTGGEMKSMEENSELRWLPVGTKQRVGGLRSR
jgi:hypothetical protein